MNDLTDDLNLKIDQLIQKKNFSNPIFNEWVTEYVQKHTELFGHIVSADELISRIDQNLDKITIIDSMNEKHGEYLGRTNNHEDRNEIILYGNLSTEGTDSSDVLYSLWTEETKQAIKAKQEEQLAILKCTFFHELTHAAYSIKGDYGYGEKQIFAEFSSNIFGAKFYSFTGGKSHYMEAITNFISTTIEGRTPYTYIFPTKAIGKLAEKLGCDDIIKAAWVSDESILKDAYTKKIGDSYDKFDKCMSKLHFKNIENSFERSSEVMQDIDNILASPSIEKEQSSSTLEEPIYTATIFETTNKKNKFIEWFKNKFNFKKNETPLLAGISNPEPSINSDFITACSKVKSKDEITSYDIDTLKSPQREIKDIKRTKEIVPTL